jgi:putative membrane protein
MRETIGIKATLRIAPRTEEFVKKLVWSQTEIRPQLRSRKECRGEEVRGTNARSHTKTSTELKTMVPPSVKTALLIALDDASQR